MKNSIKLGLFLLCCTFFVSNHILGQTNSEKLQTKKVNSSLIDIYDNINLCRWKYDARAYINFSFDDNNQTHKKISQIFDQYGFKATFFVNADYMYVDSLKDIVARGHEIGNHTYSHIELTLIDSLAIDFQIRKSKEMIENALGSKCLSFAEPNHALSQLAKSIVNRYHLFDRDYSEYLSHSFFEMSQLTPINNVTTYIENGISNQNAIYITGHGIDGVGYGPISNNFLKQALDYVKLHTDNGDLWVTTIKEGNQYENLYKEIELDKSILGDTIKLNIKNYDKNKYKDADASPISIKIPYVDGVELMSLTSNVDVKKLTYNYVITTDLKKDTSLVLVMKANGPPTDSLNEKIDQSFIIFPNPVESVLNLKGEGTILSIEIYDFEGQLLLRLAHNNSQINVSQLLTGSYLMKIKAERNNSIFVNWAKFIKIK